MKELTEQATKLLNQDRKSWQRPEIVVLEDENTLSGFMPMPFELDGKFGS